MLTGSSKHCVHNKEYVFMNPLIGQGQCFISLHKQRTEMWAKDTSPNNNIKTRMFII